MPLFEIEAGGKRFEIEAPDQAAAAAAFRPPAGAVPGSREYADWAATAARAGIPLPQVSDKKWTETQSSVLDPLVQGTTFGFADELRGAVQGGIAAMQGGDFGDTYNRVVDESRNALDHERRVNPIGSIAAEVAGAIPTAMVAGGQLVGRGANAVTRALTNFGVGASQGAVYGAGAADDDARLEGAVTGGLVGGGAGVVVPVVAGAARNAVASPAKAAVAAAPDAAAIKAQGSAGYEAAKASGVQVRPEASSLLAQDFRALLQQEGMILPDGSLSSGTGRIKKALAELDQFTGAPMDMAQFQTLRETVQEIARSPKGKQAAMGRAMLERLDEFAESLPDDAFVGTGGPEAVAKWQAAKADWARGSRANALETALYNARMTPSGDFATRLRSQFGSVLKKHRKRSQGFSKAEVKAMEKFVEGGPLGDLMRTFAQGGGLPSSLVGGVTAGPVGAATGAGLSLGSRMWLDKSAQGAANALRANVATPGGLRITPAQPAALSRIGYGGTLPLQDQPRNALSNLMFPVR